jgi:hypothetical protein
VKNRIWIVERVLRGGTYTDWVEICRCDSGESAAAVLRAILDSAEPPEEIRIKPLVPMVL